MRRQAVVVAAAALATVLTGCGEGSPSSLDPEGSEADVAATLWWILLALAGAVFVVVMGALAVGLWRRRAPGEDAAADETEGDRMTALERRLVVGGGVIMPALVLFAVGGFTVDALVEIDREPTGLEIEVVGKQFWWEVRYPEAGVVTANEVHIPTGQDVTLRMTSTDVIHSFWVPELAGKRDLVPGRVHTLVLDAREPGVYRGQCAEYCGIQHANMATYVVAHEPDDFERWLREQARPAPEPETAAERRGLEVFETEACAGCHTIRGSRADGDLGPDLTHLASRRTIGAGTVDLTRGNLGGWVVDAQSIKPGALMPPVALDAEQLTALLAYLESLE